MQNTIIIAAGYTLTLSQIIHVHGKAMQLHKQSIDLHKKGYSFNKEGQIFMLKIYGVTYNSYGFT